MLDLRYFVYGDGRCPFEDWLNGLDVQALARVTMAVARLGAGNFSNAKSVGSGVLEYRIDTGPGYRVYFGRDGERVVILLTGGTKRRQQNDIAAAHVMWELYRKSRSAGRG
jgi:putative addiction module killer protein